jgi:lipoate-protein ligase B
VKRNVYLVDLDMMPYAEAWQLQKSIVEAKQKSAFPDVILLVEHPSVVTMGRGAKQANLLVSPDELNQKKIDFFRVERGGDVTYHGPGQQVGYFLLSLQDKERDVSKFVNNLEEILLLLLENLGIKGRRRTILQRGIFIGRQKIASVGVAVKDNITYHGFALNNEVDLRDFSLLNPCGIPGMQMTSIKEQLGHGCPHAKLKELVYANIETVFNRLPVEIALEELKAKMASAARVETEISKQMENGST